MCPYGCWVIIRNDYALCRFILVRNKDIFLGLTISILYLWDFETNQFAMRAFFDPVAKVSILLPSVAASISFHIQVFIIYVNIQIIQN